MLAVIKQTEILSLDVVCDNILGVFFNTTSWIYRPVTFFVLSKYTKLERNVPLIASAIIFNSISAINFTYFHVQTFVTLDTVMVDLLYQRLKQSMSQYGIVSLPTNHLIRYVIEPIIIPISVRI